MLVIDPGDARVDVVDLGLVNLDPPLAEMAVAAAVAEIDQEPDCRPHRQDDATR